MKDKSEVLCKMIDAAINGKSKAGQKKMGFVLMTFPFGEGGTVAFMSNAEKEDAMLFLSEQVSEWKKEALN